jgi:hypothetical protein
MLHDLRLLSITPQPQNPMHELAFLSLAVASRSWLSLAVAAFSAECRSRL